MREAYLIPDTLEAAAALLAEHGGRARVVGGGTDYFVDEAHNGAPILIDVTRLRGLREIREAEGYVLIGCGVTHAQIVASPLIQRGGTALVEACGQIGGPQVRNVATLAGNIAHALPAADGTLALLALGGEIQVAWHADGALHTEWWPLARAFKGPGQSAVDSTRQIIAAMRFKPTGANEASAFARVMRPQGVALPIMGLAARVQFDAEGRIAAASIATGPAGPVPFRALQTEAFLIGRTLSEVTLNEAAQVLLQEVHLRTSPHRATAEYRREVLPVLLRRALTRCAARARGELITA
ncbi:MAG: FAD binding domain-containing protein [Thermoflexales bacterium]|nr:FAD binding domain-containing protein [Thermoflexales bacterium]MCX7937968.1 FAD binding domain-containing protein [Thermoflexales bacterium]MDW8054935.1 FAD binding domain-containing protein [Anaerolineae bacterium]MDW8293496.1 FAD binding domain-containing protein [Anaerolineae bacterium]